jgi:hypothetical protein
LDDDPGHTADQGKWGGHHPVPVAQQWGNSNRFLPEVLPNSQQHEFIYFAH